MLLKREGYTVVGEVNDGQEALQFIKNNTVDLLLTEIDIPSLNGLDLVKRLRKSDYSLKILVMGGQKQNIVINHAISIGANGYIVTRDDISQIIHAIHAVMSGYCYFPMQSQPMASTVTVQPHSQLSMREIQVLRELTTGKKSIHIAEEMNISFKTVSTYKCRIMKKLNLGSMVDLMDYVRTHQL
jgi:two-component system response regulator EvgA